MIIIAYFRITFGGYLKFTTAGSEQVLACYILQAYRARKMERQ